MKIQTIEYFITLAESGTISEAAQKLYIAQPSLTKALKLMEEELGVRLFTRGPNGIRLTPAGAKILPEAKQVAEYYRGWKELSKHVELEGINLYTYISFPDFLFPDIIMELKKKYPGLNVKYDSVSSPEKYISVNIRRPVVALVPDHREDASSHFSRRQGNPSLKIMDGEYRCLVSAQSTLARKGSITIDDLKNFYLVVPNYTDAPDGAGFLAGIIGEISTHCTSSHIIEVETLTNVITLVGKDTEAYALSYYPAMNRYASVADGSLVSVPITNLDTGASLYVYFSENAYSMHPQIRDLVNKLYLAAENFSAHYSSAKK